MEENKVHFRHLMLFYFRKGKNAAQTAKKICIVYGDSAVAESTVLKWFTRFRNDNFDLEDRERSDKPAVVDDDDQILIENNPRHTTRDIAEIFHISHMSYKAFEDTRVHKSLRCLGASQFEKNLMDHISAILCSNATKMIHF